MNESDASLRSVLARGVGAANAAALRERCALDRDADDATLARALLAGIVAEAARALADESAAQVTPSGDDEPSRVFALRSSYVTHLPATARADAMSVEGLRDVAALLALSRAGSVLQRRAAVRRLGELLLVGAEIPDAQRARAVTMLTEPPPAELAYEIMHARSALPGAEGRAVRAERKVWSDLVASVSTRIVAFWDGQEHVEPIAALGGEARAQMFSLTRDLPDLVIQHVSAVIEGCAGQADRNARRVCVRAVEHAGDPRLLPALRSVVESHDAELLAPAARSLSCTEDPRVHGLLKEAYERAARPEERLILGAALGAIGDARAAGYVQESFAAADAALLPTVLYALAELGSTDDVQRVCELLESPEDAVQHAAVATLARIADSRALVPLASLRERTKRSALRAEIEDSQTAIHARMELLGEEAAPPQSATATWDTTKMAALVRAKDPASVRLRAAASYAWACVLRTFGAHTRAIARFEAAAALRNGAIEPVLAVAMLRAKRAETAQALAAFRRATQIDRAYVEAHGWAITAMAQAFLRRAEAVEREGRIEIARGLTEEILGFDLRRASERVRLALRERGELHGVGGI